MIPGSLVIAALPQADGFRKNRPALLLVRLPPFGDSLLCGVSTQPRLIVPDLDEVIAPGAEDFSASGLACASLVRLGYLAVVPLSEVKGTIGRISAAPYRRLMDRLTTYLRREAGL